MKTLMLHDFVPNDVLRCQFYTCKADEWFGKFVLIITLQENGITPSTPSQWPMVQLSFRLAYKSIIYLSASSQSIHVTPFSLQAGIHDWELILDGQAHAPLWALMDTLSWLPASTWWRKTSFDRRSENALCCLLCFPLSTLPFPLLSLLWASHRQWFCPLVSAK